jgi:hypothetical protein
MSYTLTLINKHTNEIIDTTLFHNCISRTDAVNRSNVLLLMQGLKNKYKTSLKRTINL